MRIPAIVLCLLLLSSCGSDSGPTDPGDPGAGGTHTIGASGGDFAATSGEVRVQVQIPPGAVIAATEFTLRAVETQGLASFEIGPMGVALREAVTITIEVPESWENPESIGISMGRLGDHTSLPVSYDAVSRELTVHSYYLGFPRAPIAETAGSEVTKREIIEGQLVQGAARKSDTTDFLDMGETDCFIEKQALQDRVEQAKKYLTADGSISIVNEPLTALASQLQVLDALCLEEVDVESIVNALSVQSCLSYFDAIVEIESDFPPTTQEGLESWFLRLIAAEAVKQMVGMSCGDPIEDVIAEGINRYIDQLIVRFQTPGYLDDQPWSVVWNEMDKAAINLRGAASKWGVQIAVDRVNQELLPAQYYEFRRSAFRSCTGEDNDQGYLADLLTGGYLRNHPIEPVDGIPWWAQVTAPQLIADAQYCGSPLKIEIYDALADLMESLELGPGDEPGEESGATEISVPYDGFIDLLGPIRALRCYSLNGSSFSEATLVLRIDDQVYQSFQPSAAGDFLAAILDLSVAQLLEAVGLPEEAGQQFSLTLTRQGDACDGQYGDPDFQLFDIAVTTSDGICDAPPVLARDGKLRKACELVVTFEFPERVYAEQSYPLTVHVENPQGEPVEGAQLQIGTKDGSGSVGDGVGVTDAAGDFVTGATIDRWKNELLLQASASLGAATGEGVTSALRHNQIEMISRTTSGSAGVSFRYFPDNTSVTVYADGDGVHDITHYDPIDLTWEAQGSGSGAGMSASGQVTVLHQSELVLQGGEFVSCTHHAEINGTASLQDANLEIPGYGSGAEGTSRLGISFAVWGDPASFNLSFSQGNTSRASLSGPDGYVVCYQGGGPCPPDDDDDKTDSHFGTLGKAFVAKEQIMPGRYNFHSTANAGARFHPDPEIPNQGSETFSETVDVQFSISQ